MSVFGRLSRVCPHEIPRLGEVAEDRGRRGDLRGDEMRAAACPLPAFEVPVRRRRAPLTRREDIRVHPETHRAAGPTPFEAGLGEYAVESLGLRLLLHARRPRDD